MFAFLLMFGFLAAFSFGGSSPADETPPDETPPDETPDDNIIDGTEDDDLLTGTDANELIRGFGGNDTLEGGGGFDTLEGGAGDDLLTTETGGWLYGGEGNDTLIGHYAELYGGAGDDLMQSNGEGVNFHIDGGNDTAIGDDGWNAFHLYEGFETALIEGGRGEDFLLTDLVGEAVMDANGELIFTATSGGRAVATGIDRLNIGGGRVDASASSRALDIWIGDFDSEIIGSAFGEQISGGAGDDLIHAGDGDDTLSGYAGNDTLYGEGGDDVLNVGATGWADGGSGDDVLTGQLGSTLNGGEGDDSMRGGSLMEGGAGNDTLISSDEEATLRGGEGDDLLRGIGILDGGDGDDVLFGHRGAILTGGAGNDIFQLGNEGGDPEDANTITDFAAGEDHIEVTGSYAYGDPLPVFTLEPDAESNSVSIFINGNVVATVEGTTEIAAEDITFYHYNYESGDPPEPVEIA
ncbi:calcium-binding protein [Pararhodobacter sp. CCB-MM2]|uniref:calcium-binding protein n=1 Tax=Pararhodobacter sp. CCB-MM2 TaxID=1786003 RepID=UPI0008314F08|nr:calcium-binding protein [Pararhodobacter sp. CCB-MM2]